MLAVGLKKFHEECYELSDFLDRTLSLGLDETVSCKWHTTGCFQEEQFRMLVYVLTLFGASLR